jgi:hypothetical protein
VRLPTRQRLALVRVRCSQGRTELTWNLRVRIGVTMMSKESVEHKPTVTKVDNERYPFLVQCNCAWQAHARSQATADRFKRMHEGSSLWLKATKGYQTGRL